MDIAVGINDVATMLDSLGVVIEIATSTIHLCNCLPLRMQLETRSVKFDAQGIKICIAKIIYFVS